MLPKVLLVEDDATIREIYALKLQLEGFEVDTAENGQVGLERLESFAPQIILLDMMMPVMGGVEFLQNLRTSGKPLPLVIVFSNISAQRQVDSVMQLGATAYWVKADYTPERFIDGIMRLWHNGQPGDIKK